MLPELTAIGISLASLHFPYDGQNQFNPGLHLEAERYRAGVYVNSREHITIYAGYAYPLTQFRVGGVGFNLSIMGAVGTGYKSPVIGGLELNVNKRLVFLAVPGIKGISSTTVGFGVLIPVKE